jgi:hypothetical protein
MLKTFAIVFLTASAAGKGYSQDSSHTETCEKLLSGTTRAAICFETVQALTITRTGGQVEIYYSLLPSRVQTPVKVDVSISAPGNSSGIHLAEGGEGKSETVNVNPGLPVKNRLLMHVRTEKNNVQSGTIQYSLKASVDSRIQLINANPEVSIVTVP